MKSTIQYFIILFFVTSFISCGNKSQINREDAAKFYTTLYFIDKNINLSNTDFVESYNEVHKSTELNNSMPITDSTANYLMDRIKVHLALVDSTILVVKSMNEPDKNFKMIEKMLAFLNDEKAFFNEVMTPAVQFHLIGLNNLNEDQKKTYNTFESRSKKNNELRKASNDEIHEFGLKYNLKKSYLKELNLIPAE